MAGSATGSQLISLTNRRHEQLGHAGSTLATAASGEISQGFFHQPVACNSFRVLLELQIPIASFESLDQALN